MCLYVGRVGPRMFAFYHHLTHSSHSSSPPLRQALIFTSFFSSVWLGAKGLPNRFPLSVSVAALRAGPSVKSLIAKGLVLWCFVLCVSCHSLPLSHKSSKYSELSVKAYLRSTTLSHATGLRHELFRVNQTYNSLTAPKSCRRPAVSLSHATKSYRVNW